MRAFAPLAGIAFLADTVSATWDCDSYKTVYEQLPEWDRFVRATNYYRCLYNYDNLQWDDTLALTAKAAQLGCPAMTWRWDPDSTDYVRNTNYLKGEENLENTVKSWYDARKVLDTQSIAWTKDSEYVALTGIGATNEKVTDYFTLIWKDLKTIGCYVDACRHTTGAPESSQACTYGGGTSVQNKKGTFIANLPAKNGKLAMTTSAPIKPVKSDACCMKSYDISTPSKKVGDSSVIKPKVVSAYTPTPPPTPPTAYTPTPPPTPPPTSYGFDCDSFTCPVTKKVNKGKSQHCGALLTDCTEALCCTVYAECHGFSCPSTHVNTEDFCKGPSVSISTVDCAAKDCCEPRATCDSFKGCTGTDAAGNDISKNRGATVACAPAATGRQFDICTIKTCCTAGGVSEDSCFPGEAQVSLQDRSTAHVNDIETGMTVFTADGFEQVFGMLHLHSEVSSTFAHASTASV